MTPDIPDILDQAADEVSLGWCQGSYGHWDEVSGPVCAQGALRRVISARYDHLGLILLTDGSWQFWEQMVSTVERYSDLGGFSLYAWNDRPNRTAGEVADLLRTAAKKLRG